MNSAELETKRLALRVEELENRNTQLEVTVERLRSVAKERADIISAALVWLTVRQGWRTQSIDHVEREPRTSRYQVQNAERSLEAAIVFYKVRFPPEDNRDG